MIDLILLLALTGSVVLCARLLYPERIRWGEDGSDQAGEAWASRLTQR